MTYKEIANTPTLLKPDDVADKSCRGWHESLLRSYHIVQKIKVLLQANTHSEIVLELIELMESDQFQPYGWHVQQYHEQSNHEGCAKCPR